MDYHGIDCKGYLKLEYVSVLPTWQASDERRIVYCAADHNLYYADNTGWVLFTGSYIRAFTNASLSSGVLAVTHSYNTKYVMVQVYNNNDKLVFPDGVTLLSTLACSVDLSSFGTISGTWHVIVKK
jgi:hypothetical protein